MRYPLLVFLLFGLFFVGCDSGAFQQDGLDLTVVNQTTASWELHRSDTGESWVVSGDSWHKFFRCYNSDCEFELLAKPAVAPPTGCQGWEKETRTIRVPDDYHRTKNWELDEYDLQPLPRDCADEKTQEKTRKRYRTEK